MKKNVLLLFTIVVCLAKVQAQNFYTLTVVQPPTLEVNIGPDLTTCFYDSIEIGSLVAITGGEPPYTLSWFPTHGLSDLTVPNPMALPDDTTTYTLTVTDANNCTSWSQMTVMIDPCAYISEKDNVFDLNVFPNPSSDGLINLEIRGHPGSYYTVNVFSIYGQEVYKMNVESTSNRWHGQIDMTMLSKGIYVLEVMNEHTKNIKKIAIY